MTSQNSANRWGHRVDAPAVNPAPKPRQRGGAAAARSLALVLNLVRLRQAETRQEIERASELGRAIVADRLGSLAEIGLIDESETGVATGGRAPRLVQFRKDTARLLVATLDQTAIGVAVADLSGQLLTEHHEAFDQMGSAEAVTNRLSTLFDWLMERLDEGAPVWGIGISMPVPVQSASSGAYMAATPALLPTWGDYPFVEQLTARYQAPVWLRSSVETMTMAEIHMAPGGEIPCMLFIKIGKRIGAAMAFDGQLYRGAQGTAGLIGQSQVTVNGRTGSLDMLAGSDAIARAGQAAAEAGTSADLAAIHARGERVTAIHVGQAAQLGDPVSLEIMAQSGRLIGQVVASLANMLNPSQIVLSGSVAQTNDILLAAVREAVYGESHPLVTRDLSIGASQLGSSAGLIGAASIACEGLFAADFLKSWITLGTPLAEPGLCTAVKAAKATCAAPPAPPDPNGAPPAT